jgi:hypothetical protein
MTTTRRRRRRRRRTRRRRTRRRRARRRRTRRTRTRRRPARSAREKGDRWEREQLKGARGRVQTVAAQVASLPKLRTPRCEMTNLPHQSHRRKGEKATIFQTADFRPTGFSVLCEDLATYCGQQSWL